MTTSHILIDVLIGFQILSSIAQIFLIRRSLGKLKKMREAAERNLKDSDRIVGQLMEMNLNLTKELNELQCSKRIIRN